MSILKFVRSMLASKSERRLPLGVQGVAAPKGPYSAPELGLISAELDRAASLLLTPDPQSVRSATAIVQSASIRIGTLARQGVNEQSRNDLINLEDQLRRTRSLAEGAMRIQWANLRRLLALTQSYAPPGRLSQFKDRWTRIDLKV